MSHHPNHAHKLSILDEIDSTTPRAQDAPPAAFDRASDMEDPLRKIRTLAIALDRIAQTLDDENGALIVQQLGWTILEYVEELDDIHGYFHRLHHPDRERFEREGWPDEQATEAVHD
jgi:hypothetical protein